METKNDYKGTPYPKECFSAVRTKTFAVTPELVLATAKDGQAPAKIYNQTFSRLVVAIINEAKVPVTANIPISNFADIVETAHNAQLIEMMQSLMPQNTSTASAPKENADAYEVRITAGRLKGKTPAEVLLNDPQGGKSDLEKQRDWLRQNVQKYPANAKQIDAINSAIWLLEHNQLDAETSETAASSGKRVCIYDAKYHALIRKQRSDGLYPVYDVSIYYTIGNKYPAEVTVANYFAPVDIKPDKTISVQAQKAVDKIETTFLLSRAEWNDFIRSVQSSMHQFEVLNARLSITDAQDADRRNRENKK